MIYILGILTGLLLSIFLIVLATYLRVRNLEPQERLVRETTRKTQRGFIIKDFESPEDKAKKLLNVE